MPYCHRCQPGTPLPLSAELAFLVAPLFPTAAYHQQSAAGMQSTAVPAAISTP